jgi:hypothetical protein
MISNLDHSRFEYAASLARDIREWIGNRSHPESYASVTDLGLIRDFVHTLDLLETVLTRFEITAHLAKLALHQLEQPERGVSLGWEFWQIDVEEIFAASILESCYQISNAWKKLCYFADRQEAFRILTGDYQGPGESILARHKATHFEPEEFESHRIAQQYSILRRPYRIRNGVLEKELAKETMPRVAAMIQQSVEEGVSYLDKFRRATAG